MMKRTPPPSTSTGPLTYPPITLRRPSGPPTKPPSNRRKTSSAKKSTPHAASNSPNPTKAVPPPSAHNSKDATSSPSSLDSANTSEMLSLIRSELSTWSSLLSSPPSSSSVLPLSSLPAHSTSYGVASLVSEFGAKLGKPPDLEGFDAQIQMLDESSQVRGLRDGNGARARRVC